MPTKKCTKTNAPASKTLSFQFILQIVLCGPREVQNVRDDERNAACEISIYGLWRL